LGSFPEYKAVSASRYGAYGEGISSKVVSCKSVYPDDSCFRSYGISKRRAYALDLVNHYGDLLVALIPAGIIVLIEKQ
jgi:hypothetical protein